MYPLSAHIARWYVRRLTSSFSQRKMEFVPLPLPCTLRDCPPGDGPLCLAFHLTGSTSWRVGPSFFSVAGNLNAYLTRTQSRPVVCPSEAALRASNGNDSIVDNQLHRSSEGIGASMKNSEEDNKTQFQAFWLGGWEFFSTACTAMQCLVEEILSRLKKIETHQLCIER